MKYQAVLFDFDYTLGDATDSIYEGYCYGFERMGLPRPELEGVRATVGYILEDGFTMLSGDTDPQRRAQFRGWFQQRVEGRQAQMTRLFPGAEDLLRKLHSHGVGTGIVTSKRLTTLHTILERFGLEEVLGFTIGGEGVARPKPDPQGLNMGIAALGAPREAVLYCGDTTIDAATAQNAGVDFAAVCNGTTKAPAFGDYPHVHIAPDLVELGAWLEL